MNHLQNTYTKQRILPKQELFPTERQQTCHRHRIAPISPDIGTEQQTQFEQQNKIKSSRTRDHAQNVHTTQTYQTSQTKK